MEPQGTNINSDEQQKLLEVLTRIGLEQYLGWILTYKSYTQEREGKLISLDLSWLAIQHLPTSFLKGLDHLEKLRLDSNPNLSFSTGCFDEVPMLQTIQMKYCNLHEIPGQIIDKSITIKEIDLSRNPIKQIQAGDFKGYHCVEKLELSNTGIQQIDQNGFDGLYSLKELRLTRNFIAKIKDHTFIGLEKLQNLELQYNQIQQVEEYAFHGLKQLNTLRLDHNLINELPPLFIASMPNLKKISVVNNNLIVLGSSFSNNSSINKIDLETNFIENIEKDSFTNLSAVKTITLSSNLISKVHPQAFDQLPALNYVNLLSNNIGFDEVKHLPKEVILNFEPLIEQADEETLYTWVKHNHENKTFINCVIKSGKATERVMALLRLLDGTNRTNRTNGPNDGT